MRPNILWLLTDEHRRDSVGCYGAPWAVTPHLDALAAGGRRFAAAYTPSPVCVSARVAMLTGHAPARTGVLNNHQALAPERARFLTHLFRDAGYQTASFGKQHYNCPEVRAFALEAGRVLDHWAGYTAYGPGVEEGACDPVYYPTEFRHWLLAGRFPGPLEETAEAQNAADAEAWLAARDPAQPWFLRLSLNAPHTPVVAPEPCDRSVDPADVDLPIDAPDDPSLPAHVRDHLGQIAGAHRLTREQILRTRQAYYGRAQFVDAVVGGFLARLRSAGHLEHTLIVFCADHGAHLADHGFYQKQSFYEESAAVPFIVSGPGVEPGVTEAPVNLGGLLPTLLEICDLAVPDADYPSLAPALRGRSPAPQPVFGEVDFGIWGYRPGDAYGMVREGRWKYCRFHRGDPDPLLFDLARDPGERRNLALAPEQAKRCAELSACLSERWQHTAPEPRQRI